MKVVPGERVVWQGRQNVVLYSLGFLRWSLFGLIFLVAFSAPLIFFGQGFNFSYLFEGFGNIGYVFVANQNKYWTT